MIENVVFDLGAVLYAIDYGLTDQAFSNLLKKYGHTDTRFPTPDALPVMYAYERGQISTEAFRPAMKQALALPDATDAEFDEAWNALLLGMLPNRPEALASLKDRYRMVLLSNTNDLHWQALAEEFASTGVHLDKLFLSYEMEARKPETAIYERMLTETGFLPERTIFIDDLLPNLETAQKLGIRTFHMTGEPAFAEFLKQLQA
jgi:glucose-1-phosphatase